MLTVTELHDAELYFFVTDLDPSSSIPPSLHGIAGRCPRELSTAAASLVSAANEEKQCGAEDEAGICPSTKSSNTVSHVNAWDGHLKLVGHWTIEEPLEQSLRVPVFPSTRRNASLFSVFFLLPKGRSLHPADYPFSLPALQNGLISSSLYVHDF